MHTDTLTFPRWTEAAWEDCGGPRGGGALGAVPGGDLSGSAATSSKSPRASSSLSLRPPARELVR